MEYNNYVLPSLQDENKQYDLGLSGINNFDNIESLAMLNFDEINFSIDSIFKIDTN